LKENVGRGAGLEEGSEFGFKDCRFVIIVVAFGKSVVPEVANVNGIIVEST
jgi:hypothetical protein